MGLRKADFTTPNSPARVQCLVFHRSDWFGDQISRQIGIGDYAMFANDHNPPKYAVRFAA
ncbi:MAG: hypothetical protein ACK519_03460 [Sphingomonadaceae bacterium]|jgi:hypothetical protein